MIGFKQFITEAKKAPLYHATEFRNAVEILTHGFEPRTNHYPKDLLMKDDPNNIWGIKGVSTTRSLSYAKTYRDADLSVIFELDQNAIQSRYRVVPINYWHRTMNRARLQDHNRGRRSWDTANEFEEFIVTSKAIAPKYITAIHLFKGLTLDPKVDEFIKIVKSKHPDIKIVEYIR